MKEKNHQAEIKRIKTLHTTNTRNKVTLRSSSPKK